MYCSEMPFGDRLVLKKSNQLEKAGVTRFGEILPLGQNLKILWHYLKALISIWQNFELTLTQKIWYWVNFHCCKLSNIEKF